jgi:hypothetical protein
MGDSATTDADRFYLATLGPIPRLWCLGCEKSEHAAEPGASVAPGRLAELRQTHRCGERTSPWGSGDMGGTPTDRHEPAADLVELTADQVWGDGR